MLYVTQTVLVSKNRSTEEKKSLADMKLTLAHLAKWIQARARVLHLLRSSSELESPNTGAAATLTGHVDYDDLTK